MSNTKGPWYITGEKIIDENEVTVAILNRIQVGEPTADAHLIAAAPDMHRALETVRKILIYGADSYDDALKLIEDALDKAEGRSHE